VLSAEVKRQAQELFNLGRSKSDVAKELGVKYDTLRKAVSQGRLSAPAETKKSVASNKSERTVEDAAAEMGIACTRPDERMAAALARLPGGASTCFEPCHDVFLGGVLCALPSLIASNCLAS
jgi:transposase-like protein